MNKNEFLAALEERLRITSSGSVRVPADEGSDLCTIRTSSGDIRLE